MGFLDKLLGRDKAPTGADAQAEEESRPHGPSEDDSSDLTHDEQRLDDIRDQALRDEGRML